MIILRFYHILILLNDDTVLLLCFLGTGLGPWALQCMHKNVVHAQESWACKLGCTCASKLDPAWMHMGIQAASSLDAHVRPSWMQLGCTCASKPGQFATTARAGGRVCFSSFLGFCLFSKSVSNVHKGKLTFAVFCHNRGYQLMNTLVLNLMTTFTALGACKWVVVCTDEPDPDHTGSDAALSLQELLACNLAVFLKSGLLTLFTCKVDTFNEAKGYNTAVHAAIEVSEGDGIICVVIAAVRVSRFELKL